MSKETSVRREIDLPIAGEELWSLIADGDAWEGWLADDVDLEVEPGAVGSVVDDDGIERTVSVERVDEGERVAFTWWPTDEPERRSHVDLIVLPRPGGSGLEITETFLTSSAATTARADLLWGRRALLLWCGSQASVRA